MGPDCPQDVTSWSYSGATKTVSFACSASQVRSMDREVTGESFDRADITPLVKLSQEPVTIAEAQLETNAEAHLETNMITRTVTGENCRYYTSDGLESKGLKITDGSGSKTFCGTTIPGT